MKFFLSFFYVSILLLFISCNNDIKPEEINLSHALSLVDSIQIEGRKISFIRIYSNYPDYHPVGAQNEGIACVDDVGRFMEVLEYEILNNGKKKLIPVARGMTEFLLYMSSDDGKWNNFIYEDGSINKKHKNSRAEFGWWGIRGLRGLAASYKIFQYSDEELKNRIVSRIKDCDKFVRISQQEQSISILFKSAIDKTSELIIALAKLHNSGDFNYLNEIEIYSDYIMERQYNNVNQPIDRMYFCWENIWHAWGNNQAYSLLEVYKINRDPKILKSVKLWADNFVPFFISKNFPRKIIVLSDNKYKIEIYPQIAYGLNSVYRGLSSLYNITKEQKYNNSAEKIFDWFLGENSINQKMYDLKTGRCFDGITKDGLNRNSGAESTIECLLTMIKYQQNN